MKEFIEYLEKQIEADKAKTAEFLTDGRKDDANFMKIQTNIYEICKTYITIRENMRPYTRNLMKEAHEKGTPVMRPLFYDFPEDSVCWDNESEMMYGPDILVAPVMEHGQRTKEVYLPRGASWTHIWSGKTYEGGQTVTVDAPLSELPVFTKNDFRFSTGKEA